MTSFKLVPSSPDGADSAEDAIHFPSSAFIGRGIVPPQPKRVSICGVHEISPPVEDRIYSPPDGIDRHIPSSYGAVLRQPSIVDAVDSGRRNETHTIRLLSSPLVDDQGFSGEGASLDSTIMHLRYSQRTLPFDRNAEPPTILHEDAVLMHRPSPGELTNVGSNYKPRSLYNEEAVSLLLGLRNSPFIDSSKTNKKVPVYRMLPHKKRSLAFSPGGRRSSRPKLPPSKAALHSLRLAMPDDAQNVNSLHCYVRSELLEVFISNDLHTPSPAAFYSAGRVGLRCVHCSHLSRKERAVASMSNFFPKSLNDLYRGVCTWQRIHFAQCQHVPNDVVQEYWKLKNDDRSRGKKPYWVHSAYQLGLRNFDDNRNGIVWEGNEKKDHLGRSVETI